MIWVEPLPLDQGFCMILVDLWGQDLPHSQHLPHSQIHFVQTAKDPQSGTDIP